MSEKMKILFPVDLSETSPRIVPTIRRIAEKMEAAIHVLYVVRTMEHYSNMGVAFAFTRDFEDQLAQAVERSLAEFMEEHFKGASAESSIARGYPAEEILKYAEREEIDLIALGTHGRKGLERIIFGSVAEHVVKNASVPVLTINPYRQKAKAAA